MKMIMKKTILAAFLLSTFLLTAGPSYAVPLYFPHVATIDGWETEIAIINASSSQGVTGALRALSNTGLQVETVAVTLPACGRRQINVANEFTNHTNIGYIIFDTSSDAVQGYTKFYREGAYRTAIPAVKDLNTSDIYIPHIASDAKWWTGISLVNTTATAKTLTVTFNDGQTKDVSLAANEHRAFTIRELFNGQPQPDILSAVIANASGIIGLELFGGGNQLDGILLTDKTASTVYYPHVAGGEWWTGIVAYNPSALACTITITPYGDQGTPLSTSTLPLAGKGKYIGPVAALGLPADAAWFKIDSTLPLSGFELFGTVDDQQLAPYAGGGGTGAKAGVFAKIEKNGWTGIAFVNTETGAASVALTAYNDNGAAVANQVLSVGGYAKVVRAAEAIFSPQDINSATYITYSSDRDVVGFQLNGSADSTMLDGLPALALDVPTGLTAAGSLGNIHLSWTASTGANVSGYNIYRSSDGAAFAKLNTTPVTGTSYDDAIASPSGDGVFYYYKVTSVGDAESGASNTAMNIHGTRLASSLASGITTTSALSPYVAEGSVVSEGSVIVATGTKLYVLDNGSLDILKGNSLVVNGLFRILASPTAPATLTSHATGTALAPDEGFRMTIANCVDYASAGNSGTLLQNAWVINLQSGSSGGYPVDISDCKPKLYNLYINANNDTRAAYMYLAESSGAILQNCSLTGLYPIVVGDQRATGFQMDHNIITPGLHNYILDFQSATTAPINTGQIAYNVFDSTNALDIAAETGGVSIPLGNNYWVQGTPSIRYQNGSTSTPDFSPQLSSAPAGAGPTW